MAVYKCPKCGRRVELPEGNYYCKVCGPSVKLVKASMEGDPNHLELELHFANAEEALRHGYIE